MKMKLFYLLILLYLPFAGITQSVTTYNRAAWTVTPSSEELTGEGPINGPAAKMLDGDNATYWVSNFTDNFGEYPHTLVFDMQVAQPVNQLYYVPRDNGATSAYSGSVSFGDDGINFGTEVPVIFSKTFVQNFIILPATQNHRYFRITIAQNQSDHDGGANNLIITTMAEVGAIYNTTLEGSLTSFTTQAQGAGVKLNWSTAVEVNSTSFNITRSADAVNFTTIANIPSTGNASTAASYSFTDVAPLTGINFYRLEMVNTSGPAQKSIIKNSEYPLVAYSSSQSKNLNVFYFIPAGKASYPDFKKRMDSVVLGLQGYYKSEMQRNGRGAKTFSLVTDASHQKIKLIVVNGKYPFDNYTRDHNGTSTIQAEIDAYIAANPSPYYGSHNLTITPAFDYDPVTGIVDERVPVVGDGRNCYTLDYPALRWNLLGTGGVEGEAATVNIGGTAHEAGHSLGLSHNSTKATEPELGEALMRAGNYTFGKQTTSLTATDAAILNRCQVFNDGSISYYGPNKATVSTVHACYSPSKNAIIVAGRTATSGAAITDVAIYNDPNNSELAPGMGVNADYDAVTWTAPIIGTDSFYIEMPVDGLQTRDSSLYEMKIRLIQNDGNLSDTYYHYDFANNLPEMTDPAFTPLGATITASAGTNGSISPNGATTVNCAGNQTYTITPNAGYAVLDVLVDGVSVGAVTTYAFTGVNKPHTISATFVASAYIVSASAGSNGSITPSGAVNVTSGGNKTFTVAANSCYKIADVLVDGVSQGAISTYTFTNVTAAHTISASFSVLSYTITATAGANGSISPNGATVVNCGANAAYTITANAGYAVQDVLVDGVSQGAITTYTFSSVNAPHTITATFVAGAYIITASAGSNGSISPSGAVSVANGGSQTFTITANSCYKVADVLVDGISQGGISTYTFTNITAAHSISASFSQLSYTITASAGANGTITPNGATVKSCGSSQTYAIAANAGYAVQNVVVDGVPIGAVTSYTFPNISAGHTISATFVQNAYIITASAGANGSIAPSGAVSVTSGANKTFTITPNSGYTVQNVLVDGITQGALVTYTFTNVTANHTINATFKTSACTAPVLTSVITNVSCKGSKTGSINLTVTGTSPFTYAWTGPNSFASTSEDISGLAAGTYNVKVTASGGCTASASYAVSEPAVALSASASAGTILCNGSKTSVTVTGTGGTAPYTGTGTFANQAAGSHTYIVKDAKGCSASVTINISQPSPIYVCAIPGTLCGTGTTSVTVTASGGTAPYTGTGTFTNQSAGSHTYTVTDAKGCTTSKTITIVAGSTTPPAAPASIIGLPNNLCGGGQFVFAVSPMPGVNYKWTVPAGFTVANGQGSCIVLITVPASFTGQAVIKVAASNACGGTSAQTSLTLYATAPNLSTSIVGPSTVNAGQKNVPFILPVLPGKATFTWTVPAGATIVKGQGTIGILVNFGSTSGNVKVKFTNPCGTSPEASKAVTVKTSAAKNTLEDLTVGSSSSQIKLEALAASAKMNFKTYPNPVQSRATVEFNAQKKYNKFEIRISDASGNAVLTKAGLTVAGKNIHQFNMSGYANGMYLVTLITDHKTQTLHLIKEK